MKKIQYKPVNMENVKASELEFNPSGMYEVRKDEVLNFKDLMTGEFQKHVNGRILGHEANTLAGYFTGTEILRKNGSSEETVKMMEDMAVQGSYALEDMKPLAKKSFTEKELRNGQTNLYELFQKTGSHYAMHAKNKKLNLEFTGENTEYELSKPHTKVLAHTLYGDAIKWSPEGSQINTAINEKQGAIEILIENEIANKATENIGEGKGTGTEYVNIFLEAAQGTKTNYKTSQISNSKKPIWGTKILIPKDRNTLAELVQ